MTKAEAHWHLFLDDCELARTTGFDRVVHHPEPRGVVISADRPWETVGVSPQYIQRNADGQNLAALRGQRVHLLFEAAAADLYGFRIA